MNTRTRRRRKGPEPSAGAVPVQPRAQYLRGDRSGILQMRRAITRDGTVNVREAAARAAALAWDFMHNSGWLAGAATQVITDTIGTELKLNCRPNLSRLGYDAQEQSEFCRLVEAEWHRYAWEPRECDLAGKATIAEMLDGVIRYYLASGEAFGILDFLPTGQRKRYGIRTGTKISLVASHRLKRETNEFNGMDQGIFHDAIGRPTHYRFCRRESGMDVDHDIPAYDGRGLRRVVHVMDRGDNPDSPRGISPMTPVMKVAAQFDQLADATLATALMQTIFAATIKSPEASAAAFEAINSLGEDYDDLRGDLMDVWGQRLSALKEGGISMNDPARINHLGPGEEFTMHTASTPGSQYLPFSQNLQREMARCIGITYESLAMDHSSASYSSVKMSMASIWPIVLRRRERIAAPFCQAIYENWLDEMIWSGAIPVKGGYAAYSANRIDVVDTEWRGPERPSADPYKDALSNKIELEMGATTMQRIYAAKGLNWEEETDQIAREMDKLKKIEMPAPFGRSQGGGAGPNGAAAEGLREPAKVVE
ncbi:phage portal protein, lambda [Nitrobacter hamburgensis X14]|uniref:Phage portal protein, lambda n=2 Tax=Nitrobacter hamburgensis TaxID=912 RepID=Q1QKR5_NITHX|nr:phage portal protein, lambda [Nitrobacter hamburgensis X14]